MEKKEEQPFYEDRTFFVSSPSPKSPEKKRVLVFGTFDILHPSHLRFLYEARKTAGTDDCELVLVLARDSSILRIKGRAPIFNEYQRLRVISSIRLVDYVLLGNKGVEIFDVILQVDPDIIVLGYDQIPKHEEALRAFILSNHLTAKVHRLPKFESGDLSSSSEVREKVLEMKKSSSK